MCKSERSLIKPIRNNNSKNHLNACDQLNYQDFFTPLFLHSHEHDFLKGTVLRETHRYSSHPGSHSPQKLLTPLQRTENALYVFSPVRETPQEEAFNLNTTDVPCSGPPPGFPVQPGTGPGRGALHLHSAKPQPTAGPRILQSTGNKHTEGLRTR